MRLIAAVGMVSALALGACGGDDDEAADTTTTEATAADADGTSTTVVAASSFGECLIVHPTVLSNLEIRDARAFGPLGQFNTGADAWYIATAEGAVWASNFDPQTDESGLIAPLNQEARDTATFGSNIPPDSPLFGDVVTLDNPGAIRAADCAVDPEQDG